MSPSPVSSDREQKAPRLKTEGATNCRLNKEAKGKPACPVSLGDPCHQTVTVLWLDLSQRNKFKGLYSCLHFRKTLVKLVEREECYVNSLTTKNNVTHKKC